MTLRKTADQIVQAAIRAVQPEAAVQRALEGFSCEGRIVLVAIGKAAWSMADAAWSTLGAKISAGVVITKYHHSRGPIGPLQIFSTTQKWVTISRTSEDTGSTNVTGVYLTEDTDGTRCTYGHRPVLLAECLEALRIRPDGVYVDGTLGRAGHSLEIAKRLTTGRLIGIDRDETAIAAAQAAPPALW